MPPDGKVKVLAQCAVQLLDSFKYQLAVSNTLLNMHSAGYEKSKSGVGREWGTVS